MSGFRYNPHDPDGLLDKLVVCSCGFDKSKNHCKLHVCKDCNRYMSSRQIHDAALSNAVYIGEIPRKFDGASVIERAVAYAVCVKGHVISLESRNIGSITGSGQRSLRGRPAGFSCDSCSVGQTLPLAAAVLHTSLPSCSLGRASQLSL